MKCSEIKDLLQRAASFRWPQTDDKENSCLRAGFSIFDQFANQSAAQFAKAVVSASPARASPDGQISELIRFLRSLMSLLGKEAKPAVAKDLQSITSALEHHSNSSFLELSASLATPVKPKRKSKTDAVVRDEIVLRYTKRLEEALGDDSGFSATFSGLEANAEVTTAEIVAIAKAFANSRAKGRAAALKNIFARHQAIMVSRAKSAATAGRIAG